MTSRDVVNVVQRRLRKVKVGHAGTLDPLAEGVLVLGVGPAVRLVQYVQQRPKHYRAKFQLGVSSVSGDLEGEQTAHPDLPQPTLPEITEAAANLVGHIEQTPPAHSAIWVDGQRAYKRIRAGEEFEMPKRTVHVHSVQVIRYEYPHLELDIVCGSGTYIRTLGLDLALASGSTAVMTHLRRVGIGPFLIADTVSVTQLREDDIGSILCPPLMGVSHLPRLTIDSVQSQRLGNGLCIDGEPAPGETDPAESDQATEDEQGVAAVNDHAELRAILRRKKDQWCPYRVFPVTDSV